MPETLQALTASRRDPMIAPLLVASRQDFVHRVAGTSHYDGVKAGEPEPVVIAMRGIGPITFHPIDPSRQNVRKG